MIGGARNASLSVLTAGCLMPRGQYGLKLSCFYITTQRPLLPFSRQPTAPPLRPDSSLSVSSCPEIPGHIPHRIPSQLTLQPTNMADKVYRATTTAPVNIAVIKSGKQTMIVLGNTG